MNQLSPTHETAEAMYLTHVAGHVQEVWMMLARTRGLPDVGENRVPPRSEKFAGVTVDEADYSAMVILLLWEDGYDEAALFSVARHRETMRTAFLAGVEPEVVAAEVADEM